MKVVVLLAVLMLSVTLPLAGQRAAPYPNELPGYRFYATAKWHSLTPASSTIAEVRKALGAPDDATDLAHPVAPYPGDANVASIVFTYSRLMPEWDVLIYLSKSCGALNTLVLCSVDLVPHERIPFLHLTFSAAFVNRHVDAVDAAWNEFCDGSGLCYEIYTTKTPYDKKLPGDLNRISYGKGGSAPPM